MTMYSRLFPLPNLPFRPCNYLIVYISSDVKRSEAIMCLRRLSWLPAGDQDLTFLPQVLAAIFDFF